MNHVHLFYAITGDPRIAGQPTLLRFLTYYAVRGGQDGKVWVSSENTAVHLGIARKNVPRYRRQGEELGYLVPDGTYRRAKRYRMKVPDDPGVVANVASAMSLRSRESSLELPPGARALVTRTLTQIGALDRYEKAVSILGRPRIEQDFDLHKARGGRWRGPWCNHIDGVIRGCANSDREPFNDHGSHADMSAEWYESPPRADDSAISECDTAACSNDDATSVMALAEETPASSADGDADPDVLVDKDDSVLRRKDVGVLAGKDQITNKQIKGVSLNTRGGALAAARPAMPQSSTAAVEKPSMEECTAEQYRAASRGE